ncbi:lipopolysaccharide biosynthesis protein [Faecalicoccus sp.]|uniref:lipopolysaccharide biosynthesis protein n=1 Tax=Faecalicoccus sp. TaxID=1971758 RepID=UPI002A8101DB|nr:oligosaccharide flippase family protein [Faecalicoccus sp.]MDY5110096.1 oligosaccharide flippase family protein [Faecalicoccus sp.]
MKTLFGNKLLEKKSMQFNSLCYTLGTLCSSATSVLLMLMVTRILGIIDAGVFSISYSVAQLMLTIGWFSTRSFQVSDIKEEYSFSNYFLLKIILSVISILGGVIYSIFLKSDPYTFLITVLCCVFNLGDIFADFFSARFQQIDRLYLAGISYVLRTVGYCIVFFISILFFKNLALSIILALLYSCTELLLFDYPYIKLFSTIQINFKRDIKKLFSLVIACFPLFLSSFVTTFIINIPKNAIQMNYTDDIQAIYNILFMPSSLVNLFCMFIFVPLYTKIARFWSNGDIKQFKKMILKVVSLVFLISLLIIIGAYFLGVPVLQLIYGVKLDGYKGAFMILMLAGCLTGLNAVLVFIVTVLRKQRYILFVYIVSLICSQIMISPLMKNFGFVGSTLDYLLGIVIISILLVIILFINIKNTDTHDLGGMNHD